MYKKIVTPIIVFLCKNSSDIETFDKISYDKIYHRFFVLQDRSLKKLINFKNTDSIIILNFKDLNYETISRFVTIYTNPVYTHIVFILKETDLQKQIDNFENKEIFDNSDAFGFSRYEVAMNGFVNFIENVVYSNPLETFEKLSKALEGHIVNSEIFMLAIEELLPMCKYEFENELNLDKNILKIINQKNCDSKTKYLVKNEISENEKNIILFSNSEINNYKYVLRREDGLKCFIV